MNYRWGNPLVNRRWHLFESDAGGDGGLISQTSLCRKVGLFMGHHEVTVPVFGAERGPDDCAECWRRGKQISDEEVVAE